MDAKIAKARKKAGIPESVQPTGRVIDMTQRHWGHSFEGWDRDEKTITIRVATWCRPRPVPGDALRVEMKRNGMVEFPVLKVETCSDPDDMAFVCLGLPEED